MCQMLFCISSLGWLAQTLDFDIWSSCIEFRLAHLLLLVMPSEVLNLPKSLSHLFIGFTDVSDGDRVTIISEKTPVNVTAGTRMSSNRVKDNGFLKVAGEDIAERHLRRM